MAISSLLFFTTGSDLWYYKANAKICETCENFTDSPSSVLVICLIAVFWFYNLAVGSWISLGNHFHISKTCLGKWFKNLLKLYLGKLLCDSVWIWFNLNELTWKVWLWTQFKHGGGLADLEDFHTTCDIIWTAAALAIGWRISFVRSDAMGALCDHIWALCERQKSSQNNSWVLFWAIKCHAKLCDVLLQQTFVGRKKKMAKRPRKILLVYFYFDM